MTATSAPSAGLTRADELFLQHERGIFVRTDRMFAALMVVQWLAGISAAL